MISYSQNTTSFLTFLLVIVASYNAFVIENHIIVKLEGEEWYFITLEGGFDDF